MIIGISGKAGSGKDTVADFLVKNHSFVKVSLADPLKRACAEWFDWDPEVLWGPSEKRNEPDKRYPRPNGYAFPASVPGASWLPLSAGKYALVDSEDLERVVAAGPWYVSSGRYAASTVEGVSTYLHHFVYGENTILDHINMNSFDNRKSNLRKATRKQNNANRPPRVGSSPFKGVYYHAANKKWAVQVSVDGRSKHVGMFSTEAEAALAYDHAARKEYGEFARTNSDCFLTPRYALQTLGTEFGRLCNENLWVNYGLRVAKKLGEGGYAYDARRGLYSVSSTEFMSPTKDAVFADIRFKNEVAEFKKAGAKLIRIVRGGAGLSGAAAQHASEAEQDQIPDTEFDAVIHNEGTLEDLRLQVESVLRMLMTSAQEEKNSEDLFRFLDGKEVIVTSMTTTYPEGSSIVQEEIPMELESITSLHAASGTLAELLKKREEDVKAGKLMEYDESQKDVPPFKRKKP